jgi:putative NADPH-quinone reductase
LGSKQENIVNTLFLIASPRANGNAETLARVASESLPSNAKQTWLALRDYNLEPFQDLRHVAPINPEYPLAGGYGEAEGHSKFLLEQTLEATDIVFVAPLYWYSMPALLKRYLDEWSAWMRIPNLDFKGSMARKHYWAISVSGAGTMEQAEPLFAALEFSARFFGAKLEKRLLGRGSKPSDVLSYPETLEAARVFFEGAR